MTNHSTATLNISVIGRKMPWWLAILGLYAISRLVTSAFMFAIYITGEVAGWRLGSPRADANFLTFLSAWDSSYYRAIAEHGYPTLLPVRPDGSIQPNPWAFLPVYPLLVRGVMNITGLSFDAAGVMTSMVFGAVASIVLYRLVARRVGAQSGLWASVLFMFGPLSFVLQIAYAESLFFCLMFAALWAMIRRRYWLVLPFGLIAAFTRPGALIIPLTLAVILCVRLLRVALQKVDREPISIRDRFAIVVTGVLTAIAGAAWPWVANEVTRYPDAYLKTELAWWTSWIGTVDFVPFSPWFLLSGAYAGVFGILFVVGIVFAFIWLLTRRSVRVLGTEIVAFAAGYGLYLFAVFLPHQSVFRVLLPLSPLLGAPRLTHSLRARRFVLVAGLALQPLTIFLLWFTGFP